METPKNKKQMERKNNKKYIKTLKIPLVFILQIGNDHDSNICSTASLILTVA